MRITFGICSIRGNEQLLHQIVDSIESQNIPIENYEILIIGGGINFVRPNVKVLEFQDTAGPGWITRKKNILVSQAKFEHIVLSHDYYRYLDGWYKSWTDFGDDWDVAMNKIASMDGLRFRDWMLCHGTYSHKRFDGMVAHLDYGITNRTNEQYISGGWWMAKTQYMLEHSLDESLSWNDGEDILWSLQNRQLWNLKFNPYAMIQLIKEKYIYPSTSERLL